METKKPTRRRKSKKPPVDDHYKVLGLRSNSRQERVKEKYIELVKQYPPEQYPEEFERIRRAYETLRDPIKRQEYNLWRKHGDSIEKILLEAMEYIEQENWAKAETIFLTLLKTAPNLTSARLGLAQVYLMKDELNQFNEQIQFLFEAAKTEEQWSVLGLKAKLLIDTGYAEEALDILNKISAEYPKQVEMCRPLFIQVYQLLDREEEAIQLIEKEVASLEQEEPDYIYLYTVWINLMAYNEKWELADKVQKRVRKFLTAMRDEDDDVKQFITNELVNEYEAYFEEGYLRAATFYMDLLYAFNSNHPLVLMTRKDVQEWDRTQRDLNRLVKDDAMFPLVTSKAFALFYEETGIGGMLAEYVNQMLPQELLWQMEMLVEEYAAGIKYLQKKYPLIYRRYKKAWDQLFEEKTTGLNREARRRLKL